MNYTCNIGFHIYFAKANVPEVAIIVQTNESCKKGAGWVDKKVNKKIFQMSRVRGPAVNVQHVLPTLPQASPRPPATLQPEKDKKGGGSVN